MAAAATKKQQNLPAPASASKLAAVVDPKFEWAEKTGSYVLRLALPGFKKDDFRVQVNGAGRLTVRGTRTGATGQSSLHKVFQLPSAANLDDIAGRFEAGVLTLTVPKHASSATAPTTIEEIKRKLPGVATPKEEDALKKKKVMDEATEKTQQRRKQEEEASEVKQEQQKPAPTKVSKEEVKPKAPQAPATAPPQQPAPVKTPPAATGTPPSEKQAVVKKEEEMKPNAPQAAAAAATPPPEKPTPKPEKAAVAPESLAERVRRHGQEERAKAAAAAAAEKEAETEAEREKKVTTAACVGGWKDRTMGELKGLTNMKWAERITDMKWADGLVETARKNKEVVAVGVAAFSLGFLVSHKLFRK